MIVRIKLHQSACIFIACATIGLLPATGFAKKKTIMTTDLLYNLRQGEPWDRSILSATKTVNFQQDNVVGGGTNATVVSKVRLSYFTTADCSGSVAGSGSYTTPDGTPYVISVGPPGFGLVAASTWNVGSTKLSITDMTTINSVAVTLKSTNNNTPQACFGANCGTTGTDRISFSCIQVTCTVGPSGQCTSANGTQNFQLKQSPAAIGDPADGGVIACLGGGLNDLIVATEDSATLPSGIAWGGSGTEIGPGAQSERDGATNTAAIVNCLTTSTEGGCPGNISISDYAAGLCQTYETTVATAGYNTWFLPAPIQYDCLWGNAVAIGNFTLSGSNRFYWSSFEDSATLADYTYLTGGNPQRDQDLKSNSSGVRCVQALTP